MNPSFFGDEVMSVLAASRTGARDHPASTCRAPQQLAVRETAEFGRYVRHIRGLFEQMGLIDEGGRAP